MEQVDPNPKFYIQHANSILSGFNCDSFLNLLWDVTRTIRDYTEGKNGATDRSINNM